MTCKEQWQDIVDTCAMCFADISSTITSDACHPCFRPNISSRPSSMWASTKPLWKGNARDG